MANNRKEVYKSMGYATAIPYTGGQIININYINVIARRHAPKRIIVRLDNTKQLNTINISSFDSNVDFHIMGGYDDLRVDNLGEITYRGGTKGTYYTSAVIYKREELRRILGKIEMIEKGIKSSWSPLQKLIYVYEHIQKEIIYDPKYEQKPPYDVSSLRGLISNQSVCAGFSMILKEILDRNGVPCEYVEGRTDTGGGHAWNIVTIDGKKYALDLTWDTRSFLTSGKGISFGWLTETPEEFARTHIPNRFERTQNYRANLSQLSLSMVRDIRDKISVEKKFKTSIYHGLRRDGSQFIVFSIGTFQRNGVTYYSYFYQPVINGRKGPISILYGKYNIALLLDDIVWSRNYNRSEKDAVDNILFSEANIRQSDYIGDVRDRYGHIVSSIGEIPKSQYELDMVKGISKKAYMRSDGSRFCIRPAGQVRYFNSNGRQIPIYTYVIYESLYERGEEAVKVNTVYSEMDLFHDTRDSLIANLLTRSYLDRRIRDGGGYIGFVDSNGDVITHPFIAQNFNTGTRIDSTSYGK